MSIESSGVAPSGKAGANKGKQFTVNGQAFTLDDKDPTARQILVAASYLPADECILVQLIGKASQAVGLDETAALDPPGQEVFRAFSGDRIFRFTLSGLGCDWGAAAITEADLREIAGIDEDHVVILERDGRDRELGPDDSVELSNRGTEHFRVERGFVTVLYDGEEVRLKRGRYTTEQLIAVFGVSAGYLLNLIDEHNMLVPLKPGETIRVKKGMRFVSQVPGGGSS